MTKDLSACIYLDHHATTPLDIRVFKKMEPFFLRSFGNPASQSHPYGWHAHDAVDEARSLVAKAINAHPTEIIFTSGATESTNMAIKGLFLPTTKVDGREIITSSIEHGATLSTVTSLLDANISASIIKPRHDGLIDESLLANALTKNTSLISLFMVHNEIGAINPIQKLTKMAREHGALFHCDAAQALGRVKIDVEELDVDMMSFSGHKIYGPKGVGCLYVRRAVMETIAPLIHGGGQEWEKRSGTLNVPGIVGFGEAALLASSHIDEEDKRIKVLRDRLLANLRVVDGVFVNGSIEHRVSGNLNVSFSGIDGEELVLAICQRVAISTGSACSSSRGQKSKVLQEIGVPSDLRQASIRFGLGRTTTKEEIDTASQLIVDNVKKQRQRKPLIKLSRT